MSAGLEREGQRAHSQALQGFSIQRPASDSRNPRLASKERTHRQTVEQIDKFIIAERLCRHPAVREHRRGTLGPEGQRTRQTSPPSASSSLNSLPLDMPQGLGHGITCAASGSSSLKERAAFAAAKILLPGVWAARPTRLGLRHQAEPCAAIGEPHIPMTVQAQGSNDGIVPPDRKRFRHLRRLSSAALVDTGGSIWSLQPRTASTPSVLPNCTVGFPASSSTMKRTPTPAAPAS